jgi:hypothetical protein
MSLALGTSIQRALLQDLRYDIYKLYPEYSCGRHLDRLQLACQVGGSRLDGMQYRIKNEFTGLN